MEELQVPVLGEMKVELVNSWAGVNRRGHFNSPHVHPDAIVSGVYYLTSATASLHLLDPRTHSPVRNRISVKPEAGLFVLFPGYVEHFVDPHDSDEPRVIIAFNARATHTPTSHARALAFKIPAHHSNHAF